MEMSAENVIENWAKYVNQSDLPGLMGLYAKDATLVPTFSRKILHTPEEIEQYFLGLAKKGTLVEMHKKTLRVHQMEMGYLLNGEYTFSMNKDGKTENHPSRFSFLLDLSHKEVDSVPFRCPEKDRMRRESRKVLAEADILQRCHASTLPPMLPAKGLSPEPGNLR